MVEFRYSHYQDILVMMPILLVTLSIIMFTIVGIILKITKD